MSYLISTRTNQVVAKAPKSLKSGLIVDVACNVAKNEINANRDWGLVNSTTCKVRNAKKWEVKGEYYLRCKEVNKNEFLVLLDFN